MQHTCGSGSVPNRIPWHAIPTNLVVPNRGVGPGEVTRKANECICYSDTHTSQDRSKASAAEGNWVAKVGSSRLYSCKYRQDGR